MQFSKITIAISLLLSLAACGGGGSATSAPVAVKDPDPQLLIGTVGVFDVNYGQFSGVYTFLENGDFYGLHFVSGSTLAGHPHGPLTATNSTTSMEAISWANFIDDMNQVGAQESDGKFGRTFGTSVNVRISGSMGSFSASASKQKTYSTSDTKSLYKDPIAMSVMAGTYTGSMRTVGIDMSKQSVTGFVIDSSGNFTATAVNCKFAGKLVQHGATGIFDAQVDASGDSCHLKSPLKGIVTPLSVINNLPQLGVQLNSVSAVNGLHTAVFIVTKT